jgi:glycosyltransferase involved in cell wall biosynthesis
MNKRIRVMQLFYTFDVEVGGGGLSLFAIELGKHLDPNRFEVNLCSLGYYDTSLGKERIKRLNDSGIRSFEATRWDEEHPYQSFINAYQNLSENLKNHPIDIIHSHSEYTDITAILLKLRGRVPRILRTVHYGFRYEWSTKPLRRALLTNFTYPMMFDMEIGINQPNTDRLNNRKVAKILGKHALRIPNAISFDRFENVHVDVKAKKEALGIPPDAPLIGTVGRLADQKGYNFLIEAASTVINVQPETYFVLIGDGPLADEHKKQVKELGIEKQVIFTGGRTDVEELLYSMNLFVSSSLWEGLPTVLLEAMAANIPIVATNIPGTNELIHHNFDGWLVQPYDSDALAEGIIHLMKSPSLRTNFARNAKETMKQYSISTIADQYEVLYQQLYNG